MLRSTITHSDVWLKQSSDKQAQMAFQKTLPLDIARHILSFKDPTRQVGVKGGIKTDSASAMPINVYDESARLGVYAGCVGNCMVEGKMYYSRVEGQAYSILQTDITIWQGAEAGYFDRNRIVDGQPGGSGKRIKSFKVQSHDYLRPPSELWLQCEACGPDLELYDMLR